MNPTHDEDGAQAGARAIRTPSRTSSAVADPLLGMLCGAYRLEAVISRGHLGALYLGAVPGGEQHAAIKIIDPQLASSPAFMAELAKTADAALRLDHEHAVPLLDAQLDGDVPYLVMALHRGVTLKRILARKGGLPLDQSLKLVLAVLNALSAAHALGLVHGDIDETAIFIDRDGGIRLGGFGLPRLGEFREVRYSAEEIRDGLPQYLAPELYEGADPDPRSDCYSLGVVLFRCVAGELPYPRCSPLELIKVYATRDPEVPHLLNPEVPRPISAAILRLIAKHPLQRYQDAGSVSRDLLTYLRDLRSGRLVASSSTPDPAAYAAYAGAPARATGATEADGTASTPGSAIGDASGVIPPGDSEPVRPGYRTIKDHDTGAITGTFAAAPSGDGSGIGPGQDGPRSGIRPGAERLTSKRLSRVRRGAAPGMSTARRNQRVHVRVGKGEEDAASKDADSDRDATGVIYGRSADPKRERLLRIGLIAGPVVAALLIIILLVAFVRGGSPAVSNVNEADTDDDGSDTSTVDDDDTPGDGNSDLRRRVAKFVSDARRVARTDSSAPTYLLAANDCYFAGLALWDELDHDELEGLARDEGARDGFLPLLQVAGEHASWRMRQLVDQQVAMLININNFEEAVRVLEELAGWPPELCREENPAFVALMRRRDAIVEEMRAESQDDRAARVSAQCRRLLLELATYEIPPKDEVADAATYVEDALTQAIEEDWARKPDFIRFFGDVAMLYLDAHDPDWESRCVDGDDRDRATVLDEMLLAGRRFAGTEGGEDILYWRFIYERDYVGGEPVELLTLVGSGTLTEYQPGGHYLIEGELVFKLDRETGPGPGAGGTFEVRVHRGNPEENGRALSFVPFGNIVRALAEGHDLYSTPAYFFHDRVNGWQEYRWSVTSNAGFLVEPAGEVVELTSRYDVSEERGTAFFATHPNSSVEIRNLTWVEKVEPPAPLWASGDE